MISRNEVNGTVPLVEEGEQRFELEDRDIVQMNDTDTGMPIFILIGLLSEYTSEFGGVGKQEMFVYSEMSVPDLSNAG